MLWRADTIPLHRSVDASFVKLTFVKTKLGIYLLYSCAVDFHYSSHLEKLCALLPYLGAVCIACHSVIDETDYALAYILLHVSDEALPQATSSSCTGKTQFRGVFNGFSAHMHILLCVFIFSPCLKRDINGFAIYIILDKTDWL